MPTTVARKNVKSNFLKLIPILSLRLSRALLFLGFALTLWTFFPLLKAELGYQVKELSSGLTQPSKPVEIEPVNRDFAIVVPQIAANAKVLANVDPFNPNVYQMALSQGVAHALGSALPGESGDIFLFAHSSANPFLASRYNSVFYLLDKVSVGEPIYLYYQNKRYDFRFTNKEIVSASDVSIISHKPTKNQTLSLMTCWPAGTTYRRLVWHADLVRVQ